MGTTYTRSGQRGQTFKKGLKGDFLKLTRFQRWCWSWGIVWRGQTIWTKTFLDLWQDFWIALLQKAENNLILEMGGLVSSIAVEGRSISFSTGGGPGTSLQFILFHIFKIWDLIWRSQDYRATTVRHCYSMRLDPQPREIRPHKKSIFLYLQFPLSINNSKKIR